MAVNRLTYALPRKGPAESSKEVLFKMKNRLVFFSVPRNCIGSTKVRFEESIEREERKYKTRERQKENERGKESGESEGSSVWDPHALQCEFGSRSELSSIWIRIHIRNGSIFRK